jgi:predicted dehydrogenase
MNTRTTPRFSRRGFIAAGAAASLTAFAAPSHALRDTTARVALIGCGAGGRVLARALQSPAAPFRILAVCDNDATCAAHIAAGTGAEATSDWKSLVERSGLEAVLLAVPDGLHAPMALAAMAAGKHVYVLPPFARSAGEARQLEAQAQRCDRVLHVAADPAEEQRWAQAGTMLEQTGEPLWIQAASAHGEFGTEGWLRQREASHGPAARQLFNMLYPIQHHLGLDTPVRSTAMGGVFHGAPEATPDRVLMTLHYRAGATVVLSSASEAGDHHDNPMLRGRLAMRDLPLAPVADGTIHDLARFAKAIAGARADAAKRLHAARVAQEAVCDAMEQWARWERSRA